MKKKLDFVTNSSSTSFIAYGISHKLDNFIEKYGGKVYENSDKSLSKEEFLMDIDEDEYSEMEECARRICNVFRNKGIDAEYDYECETLYIGINPFDIDDNETAKEFKSSILDKFNSCGIDLTMNELTTIATEVNT